MRFIRLPAFLALVVIAPLAAQPTKAPEPEYVKKSSRADTIRATLASHGLPNLEGKWYHAGPFDNTDNAGFDFVYPPEKGVDLKATYVGRGGRKVAWEEFKDFAPGKIVSLINLYPRVRNDAVVYLYHTFESPRAFTLPLSLGSDDTISVFINGKRVLHVGEIRAVKPDQERVDIDIKEGKNELLIKVGQEAGEWAVYANPAGLPARVVPETIRKQLERDFPPGTFTASEAKSANAEAKHYKVNTLPLPKDCVMEVGGLAFRPDGKLLACTRRGEVWLVANPTSDSLGDVRFTKYATGLHEALGMYAQDDNTVFVVQRPELTKLVSKDGATATEFATVCDRWGVSGDYHEFAFGPARDRDGNFFVTLNVGFGGGHQAKAAWRGWCVKVSPDGKLEPHAYGLRSPNGVNFNPDGDLFYCDNQGEWVATNKMHHIRPGKFYGHQAGLRWVKDSPFAGKVPEKVASGMRYDGVDAAGKFTGIYPDLDPPCIWFPYGRMGNSVSEPVWDTTEGKFGPFAGQCFVGDQTKSVVMRVALEKVNGLYQGACFPFRSGFQCGVNRLCFAPDGSLMVGETNRGWGSIGGKPYGLERVAFTGKVPFEIHHVTLTRDGFDLVFTKPVNPKSLGTTPVSVNSFTYVYKSDYGCPETDTRFEPVAKPKLSKDGKTLSVSVAGLKKGRVYDISMDGLTDAAGEKLLHPVAYYTLNELVK
jgi:hypothetical protein